MKSNRMLKKSSSFVLASLRDLTYEIKYASPLRSLRPCWKTFLNILWIILIRRMMSMPSKVIECQNGFSTAY